MSQQAEQASPVAPGPTGFTRRLVLTTALAWSLFQLWVASPLPYHFAFGVLNSTEVRSIHLAFAIFLAFLSFPLRRSSSPQPTPLIDWLFAILGVFCALYLFLFYHQLAERAGNPNHWDIATAAIGILLLLEATRRALGWPLTLIALAFLGYTFAGPWLPEVMAHRGASLGRVASHQWLGTEGVFGVALGVSAGFVFLFVLFGSLLEKAGGGHYFIRLAFALVGHLRGGPAKAAVLASGLTGMISGSSIANVVTTGTFTIPLMKKAGFPDYRAGAIEVAASTNGQIMPPVMGAAAFLMVEYLNISYLEVIRHAFLPALLSYIALLYLVHLEAVKAGMQPGKQAPRGAIHQRLLGWGLTLGGLALLGGLVWLVFAAIEHLFGQAAGWISAALVLAAYVGLIALEANTPAAEEWDPETPMTPAQAARGGLHFLLPIAVLVWCLMILRLSPGAAVFNAILLMILIQLTQGPLRRWFSTQGEGAGWREGFASLVSAMETGATNMIGIGVATATAGIIVGTVSLTGVGQVFGQLIELLSFGSLPLMLLLTALVCMVLGMGLPTTANYIVVSTLMAPVIAQLAAANGLDIPLVAIHLFVFYFGILADDTPPVGLAAYAAAGISGGDPIRTGIQSFFYDIRTAILPFIFIFNTDLLMIGITGLGHFLLVVTSGLTAMLLFASATQGQFLTRNRWWESLILLLIAISLFRLDALRDLAYPPYLQRPASELVETITSMPPDAPLRLTLAIQDDQGQPQQRLVVMTLPPGPAENRLSELGFITRIHQHQLVIDDITLFSPAEDMGLLPGYATHILSFAEKLPQPSKYWFMLPPLLVLAVIWTLQHRRRSGPCPR